MHIELEACEPGLRPVAGVPPGLDALWLARLARAAGGRGLLHVAADRLHLRRLASWVRFFGPGVEVLLLPPWDVPPYERGSPSPAVSAGRVATLARLLEPPAGPRLVLTGAFGLLRRLPPRAAFAESHLRAEPGGIEAEALGRRLLEAGYAPVEDAGEVDEPGEFHIGGDRVLVWPPGADEVAAVAFAGGVNRDAVDLPPLSEVVLDPGSAERFLGAYRRRFGEPQGDPVAEAVAAGMRHAGMEHWQPLFHGGSETLLDWMPEAAVSLDDETADMRDHRLGQIEGAYESRTAAAEVARRAHLPTYRPLPPAELFMTGREWDDALAARAVTVLRSGPPEAGEADAGGRPGPDLSGNGQALAGHVARLREAGVPVVLAAGRADRRRLLERRAGQPVTRVRRFDAGQPLSSAPLDLDAGFVAPELAVVTHGDLAGRGPAARHPGASPWDATAVPLRPGDLVVHADHGIALCDGIETVDTGGAPHACVRLLFRDNNRLLLPVENLDLVWRYGPSGAPASLDRLGTEAWTERLGRVAGDLMAQARVLVDTAARREAAQVEPVRPPAAGFRRFVDRFPHVETQDQQAAIDAVLDDLASRRPMDRVIVGDVGFGKTEVALRAAFCVAAAGRQVAVVAPTLPLARQHARDFRARFGGFGIEVAEVMGSGRAAEARRSISEGGARIAIGTHALLGRGVRFRDLGLVIVDEEHRFGVRQKERLKQLSAGIHVLSMSATPIPRTLQLAFADLRDVSIIATPPVARRAVRTRVLEYDGDAVRDALMRECRRGGQSFYVCPRIADLETVEGRLAALVPELRVATVHGRMGGEAMDRVLEGFAEGGTDILLATNVIEAGLNIPSANTLVVHRADMFGLAQLHQLRGRVGRGPVRAACLLTTEPDSRVTAEAARRLAEVAAHEAPGAGFALASSDLDLRGAGNLVGEEQSGHLREVGAELFQDLLRRAVEAVRTGREPEAFWTPRVNFGLPVLIPENYIADPGERMTLYRAIARLEGDDTADAFADELAERHGPLPPELANMLEIAGFKHLCRQAGVEELDVGPKGVLIGFRYEPDLSGFLTEHPDARRRPDGRLSVPVAAGGGRSGERFEGARRLLRVLAGLTAGRSGRHSEEERRAAS